MIGDEVVEIPDLGNEGQIQDVATIGVEIRDRVIAEQIEDRAVTKAKGLLLKGEDVVPGAADQAVISRPAIERVAA